MSTAEAFFVRPRSLDEALELLAAGEGTMLLGGATATTLLLKNRLIEPERLVWIGPLPELAGIDVHDGALVLGAATTLRDLARSPLVREHAPAVADAAGQVGNPRVRAVATLGGALVHGDPRQDVPPVLLAARAELAVRSRNASRVVAVRDFFLGFMETALEEDEIVTAVSIPARPGWRDAYTRFTPGSEDDYPTVGAAVSLLVGDDGVVQDGEIALGGVDASAIRAEDAAAALIGTTAGDAERQEASRRAAAACHPSDDRLGSEAYKRAMVEVIVGRTIRDCLS